MSSAPSPPPVESAASIAAAQQQQNQAAQAGSLINQNNQYGSLRYNQTGVGANGAPTYTATSTLNPQQQAILNNLQQYQTSSGGAANSLLGSAIGSGQYNSAPDFSSAASSLTSKLLGQETAYLNPQFDYQKQQLDAQLRNQGLGPESVAYQQQMKNLLLTQNQSVTGFLAQAEPQAFSQALQNYTAPISISQQLAGASQPANLQGSFANTSAGNIAPANIAQAQQASSSQYANQLQAAQQNNTGLAALLGGGAQLLGGALGGNTGTSGLGAVGSGLAGLFGV